MWDTKNVSIWIKHENYPHSVGELCWLDAPQKGSALIMSWNESNYPPGGVHVMARETAILEFKILLEEGFEVIGGNDVKQFTEI